MRFELSTGANEYSSLQANNFWIVYENESVFMNFSKYFWKLYEHSEAKSAWLNELQIVGYNAEKSA